MESEVTKSLSERLKKCAQKRERSAGTADSWAHTVHDIVPTPSTSRFLKKHKIGEGAFGSVCVASDIVSGKDCVLKEVRPVMVTRDYGLSTQLWRECMLLRAIDHPNIVHLKDIMVDSEGNITLVFPLYTHDLPGVLRSSEARLPIAAIKSLFRQLLCAIEFLHRHGIVHRDVKPANVLIAGNGTLKLCDFGWARYTITPTSDHIPDRPPKLSTNLTFPPCTLFYRPPELLMGQASYGPEVDIWGAGCVLYEMLTLKPLFPGHTEPEALYAIFRIMGKPPGADVSRCVGYHDSYGTASCHRRFEKDCTALGLGTSCRELLGRMLHMDPTQRPTAHELLHDKWFEQTNPPPCARREIPLPEAPQHRFVQRQAQQQGTSSKQKGHR